MDKEIQKTTVDFSAAQALMSPGDVKIFIESVRYGIKQKYKSDMKNHILIYIDRYDGNNVDPDSLNFQLNLCLADAMGTEKFQMFSEKYHGKNMYVPVRDLDIQARNANIMKDFAAGMTSKQIGKKYGITPEAARKVKERHKV